jgi:glycosyltransferase involved in cell wall biosynthesis
MGSTGTHKPRVALFLPNLAGGGAERAFVELANRFVDLGCEVDLVLAKAGGTYLPEVSPSVRVIALGGIRTLSSVMRLRRYIRSQRPAVVMSGLDTANVANWLACWLAGVPDAPVLTQRSVLSRRWRATHPHSTWIWIKLLGFFYRRAHKVISNSQAAADDLITTLGVRPEQVTVIHNSVDAANIRRLTAQSVEHDWVSETAAPLLLLVGSLTEAKDIPTTLRAFARLYKERDCRLLVLGEGPDRAMLEKLINQLNIQGAVQMIGFDPNPFRWMARARVLVSSSPSEGCPNVILQALACGLPVVATDGPGGTSEILENGRWGRLVPVGDDQALAIAIAETLDSPRAIDVAAYISRFEPARVAHVYLSHILPSREGKAGRMS